MRTKLLLIVALFAALGSFLRGQEPAARIQDRLRQFQHDLALVEKLVNQSVQLSLAPAPIQCAESFQNVAETLVREIRQSAGNDDEKRALQMGDYLQAVLSRGVADNLIGARRAAAGNPAKEPEWRSTGERTLQLIQPLAAGMAPPGSAEERILEAAGRTIRPGREALVNIIAGKRR
ncbi:MAG: hypothetical protein FJ271_01850 [Planctomycetes bacterium]|nr:hypothetical protein [Planctomycetota bacterium]